MSDDEDPVRRACRTYRAQRAMGGEAERHPLFTRVSCPERPDVWDANFGCDVRARSPEEISRVLEALDACMGSEVRVRKFLCDPWTPQPFVAALCVRGFRRESTVQLVLEGPLRARPRPLEIRRAESDADWASVAALTAADLRERLGPPDAAFLARFVGMRRGMAEEMPLWLGRDAGRDCGYLASWAGLDRMGMVEWLFCDPAHRRRGVATALIAHAVADARARGAEEVLIGASAGDDAVPRRLYASLGFRPVCLTDEYTCFLDGAPAAA